MKKGLALLIVALLLGCSNGYNLRYPVDDSVRPMYLTSVSITNDKGRVVGSGTVMCDSSTNHMIVLTAAHVVVAIFERGSNSYVVTPYDDISREMLIAKINIKTDLAVLRSVDEQSEQGPCANLADHRTRIGEHLYAIGSPLGEKFSVSQGILSNYVITETGVTLYKITADMYFGNSGGGIFNEDGELIGVAHGMLMSYGLIPIPGWFMAVSLDHIKEIL